MKVFHQLHHRHYLLSDKASLRSFQECVPHNFAEDPSPRDRRECGLSATFVHASCRHPPLALTLPLPPTFYPCPPSSPSEGASGALTERKLKIVGARAFTAVMRQIHEELLDLIRGAALGTNRLSLYDHVLIPHHVTRASHSLSPASSHFFALGGSDQTA